MLIAITCNGYSHMACPYHEWVTQFWIKVTTVAYPRKYTPKGRDCTHCCKHQSMTTRPVLTRSEFVWSADVSIAVARLAYKVTSGGEGCKFLDENIPRWISIHELFCRVDRTGLRLVRHLPELDLWWNISIETNTAWESELGVTFICHCPGCGTRWRSWKTKNIQIHYNCAHMIPVFQFKIIDWRSNSMRWIKYCSLNPDMQIVYKSDTGPMTLSRLSENENNE